MKNDSTCPKAILCDFEVVGQYPDAQVEVCGFCRKKVIYRKDKKGGLDNKKYLRDHLRHTAQPYGRTAKIFYKIYGEAPVKVANAKKPKRIDTRTTEEVRKDIEMRMIRKYV